jgi:RNA polymerase sigma-70 factor, ECF subfamily
MRKGPVLEGVTPAQGRNVSVLPFGPADDGELVRRALSGEVRAQELLFRRHASSVYDLARHLLRDDVEAEDVLQEAFVTAHERLADLRDPHAFRAWILQIAVRLAHRRFRRMRLLAALGFVSIPDEIGLLSSVSPDASQEDKAEIVLLDKVLARLPEEERTAFLVRHVEELSLEETAVVCDCSLATIKRRLKRAQDHVAQHLSGEAS